MFGCYGRMLLIDLTTRHWSIQPIPDAVLSKTLGGKGLATHLLLEMNPPGVDPMSPENRIIFTTGPFCGTRMWGGSRYGVFTKSPLTGIYCESYSGGKTPEAIDRAGFDAVVFSGRAAPPVVVSIHPEGCDFFDAGDLWGMDAFTAETEIKKRFLPPVQGYGAPGAVVIGPAGENGVRFSTINNDLWRCAGRAGAGTVMGSKQVKAIVFTGNRKREVAHPKGVAAFAKAFAAAGVKTPGVKAYKGFGTTMMVGLMNTAGAFPTKYWTQGTCEHWEKISGEQYHKDHDVTAHACLKCFMACGRKATLTQGRHTGLTLEGPEYETIYAFGGLCMIDDMAEIAYLNDLCDRLGMDTITAGNLCGFAIEAVKRGKLDYPIDYGDAEAIAGLIRKIAAREGIGEIFAQGIRPAAAHFGLEDLAVHVKGMEPAGYDPRVLKGMGLAYATSDRGACHLRTTFYKAELSGMIDPDTTRDKAKMFTNFEDRLTIFDTLILCRFYRDLYDWETLGEAIHLVTGLNGGKENLRNLATDISNATRTFNIREGLVAADDCLPPFIHNTPLASGHSISHEEVSYMVQDYYTVRGWDEAGIPLKQ